MNEHNCYSSYPLSIKKQVEKLLNENQLLTAKMMCNLLKLDYKKYRQTLTNYRSQWKYNHENERGSKCSSFHCVRWGLWEKITINRGSALNVGWVLSKARNRFLQFKSVLGRVVWFESGTVRLHVRAPGNEGRAKQLFCDAFFKTGLIGTVEELERLLGSLFLDSFHTVVKTGQRLPYVHVKDFAGTNGFEFKSGDRTHPHCFPRGTQIVTWNGLEEIQDVRVGTEVLTHLGCWRKVTETFSRHYEGEILEVQATNSPKILVTPEHPVFAASIREGTNKFVPKTRTDCWKKLQWVPIGKLDRDSFLSFPIVSFPIQLSSELTDLKQVVEGVENLKLRAFRVFQTHKDLQTRVLCEALGVNSPKLKSNLKRYLCLFKKGLVPKSLSGGFSSGIFKLIGYYIGDGSQTSRGEIKICFNHHELDKAKWVQQIVIEKLGRKCRIYHGSCVNVIFSHMPLLRWLKANVGQNAHKKTIPDFMLYLPISDKVELLKGIFGSDGTTLNYGITKRYRRYIYTSVSSKLVTKMVFILHSLGIIPALHTTRNPHMSYIKNQGWINATKAYDLTLDGLSARRLSILFNETFPHGNRNYSFSFQSGQFNLYPITSIQKKMFKGLVYNLEVEEHHSFTTLFGSWHNCFEFIVRYQSQFEEAKRGLIELLSGIEALKGEVAGQKNGREFDGKRMGVV